LAKEFENGKNTLKAMFYSFALQTTFTTMKMKTVKTISISWSNYDWWLEGRLR